MNTVENFAIEKFAKKRFLKHLFCINNEWITSNFSENKQQGDRTESTRYKLHYTIRGKLISLTYRYSGLEMSRAAHC